MKVTKSELNSNEAAISNLRQRAFALASVDRKRMWIMIAYSNKAIEVNTMHTMHHASRYEMADTSGVSSRALPRMFMNISRIVTSKDILPGMLSGGI